MTIDEAIIEEQTLYDIAKDKYEKLGIKNCLKRMEEHKQYIEWLEKLKAIKEMDLDIPQHFTKEQSDWIKAYCIKRNTEFYNKALDDFAKALITMYERYDIDDVFESSDTYSYTSACYIFEHYIDKIAEQLKGSGQNERSV